MTRLRFLGLLMATLITPALAQQPVVQVEISPETVIVGESLELKITVLASTWFPSAPQFPSFELANTITRLPPDSSRATSGMVDGERWSGVVRRYRIWPLIAADFRMEGQTVKVTWAEPGGINPLETEVKVPEIVFSSMVPAGAEGLDPYLAGSALTLSRDIEGTTDGLETGDALVMTYRAELEGLPAIFLPELLAPETVPGVSVYPETPRVEDGPPARRSEKITLVFEAGGEYTAPSISLEWWNTVTESIQITTLKALTVNVAGPMVIAESTTETAHQIPWLMLARIALVLAVLAWAWRRYRVPVGEWLQERRAQHLASESHAFERLVKALSKGEPGAVPPVLATWLERLVPSGDARAFVRLHGDAKLDEDLESLSAYLYRGATTQPDLGRLQTGLLKARKHCLSERDPGRLPALPPLNP